MRNDRGLADGRGQAPGVAMLVVLAGVVAAADLFGGFVPHDSVDEVGGQRLKAETLV